MLLIRTDDKDREDSRVFEMKTYLDSMKAMYENALLQNGEIYDIAFNLTNKFSQITSKSILEDSRIIKIFRYAICPTISQMKFGQFFGINSIDKFENDKVSSGAKLKDLTLISQKIADFINLNLDKDRFIWLNSPKYSEQICFDYAKKWTCSIAADQNAQTAYRNWRKEIQEQAIISKLVSCGYTKSIFSGVVKKDTDINLGEYTKEIRVQGRTIQKADVVFRNKKNGKLTLVEAKAVGVELDATKRIKECCDKANDWNTATNLNNPDIVTVIAGFFNVTNISNLTASNIAIIWEHKLSDFEGVI